MRRSTSSRRSATPSRSSAWSAELLEAPDGQLAGDMLRWRSVATPPSASRATAAMPPAPMPASPQSKPLSAAGACTTSTGCGWTWIGPLDGVASAVGAPTAPATSSAVVSVLMVDIRQAPCVCRLAGRRWFDAATLRAGRRWRNGGVPHIGRAGFPRFAGEPESLRGARRLEPRPHVELAQDRRHVVVDRLLRQVQALGDLGIAQPLGQEREHVELASRETRGIAARRGARTARQAPLAEAAQTAG